MESRPLNQIGWATLGRLSLDPASLAQRMAVAAGCAATENRETRWPATARVTTSGKRLIWPTPRWPARSTESETKQPHSRSACTQVWVLANCRTSSAVAYTSRVCAASRKLSINTGSTLGSTPEKSTAGITDEPFTCLGLLSSAVSDDAAIRSAVRGSGSLNCRSLQWPTIVPFSEGRISRLLRRELRHTYRRWMGAPEPRAEPRDIGSCLWVTQLDQA